MTTCAACHGQRGEGIIGPNLTDNHWIYGGKPADLIKAAIEGFPAKGMPAWGAIIGHDRVRQGGRLRADAQEHQRARRQGAAGRHRRMSARMSAAGPAPILGSMRPDGSRLKVHPADVRGRWLTRRRAVFALLIAVYVLAPLVPVGGHPSIMLDVQHRRFYLFGRPSTRRTSGWCC